MSEQQSSNSKFEEIGALWVKQGQKGKFYAGYVELNGERTDVFLFPNKDKKSDKAPDVRLVLAPQRDAPAAKPAPKQASTAPVKKTAPPVEDDDIPF